MTDDVNQSDPTTASAPTPVPWGVGVWTHEPAEVREDGDDLLVTAVEGSDAWRHTSYGFVHDSEHALLTPLAADTAVEVSFTAAFSAQFDQAGVFLRSDDEHWIKAGVEFADGLPQVGAVVTDVRSDWSVAPVPSWAGRLVTVRASRSGDAVTIRARVDEEAWSLVRVAPFAADALVAAGPFCCAPTRPGLTVRFHSWHVTPADAALHEPA
ncbi:DUF1349 domain-containing protein [Plantibacter sp. YIM 135347]|uniref:DUF1349 domain-containing protein n=1 Tax=Plantibacter sp. YIM 135347 TaxID=3423919 RepID=UPI003D3248FC